MPTPEGFREAPKHRPEAADGKAESRTELRNLVARLDEYTDRPWFRTFVRTVMLPTVTLAEAWDKLSKDKK